MASTYSSLKFELIGTGDQSGTWGVTTNTNLGTAIEEAITGSADVAFASADVTLTLTNTNTTQTARNLRLNLTGTSGGARNLIIPSIEKFYIITNGLADTVTVKNATGTTVTIPAGRTAQVFNTGTNVILAADYFSGAVLSSAAVILGGDVDGTPIGSISPSTGAFTTLGASSTASLTGNVTIGTNSSNTLTINSTATAPTQTAGDNSTKLATTAYVATAVTNATGSLGTMSTQNANAVAITGGTIANLTAFNAAGVTTLGETTTVSATASSGTINYDVKTQGVLYYTSNATGTWVMNFRGDGSTTLNSLMAVGETRTVTFLSTQGSTAYYNTAVQVDGNALTPKWQGGSAPTAGNPSSIDIYTYSIIKTASATFTVLASQTRFA